MEEHREDVRTEGPFELLGSDLLDRILHVLLGGVIDQYIQVDEIGDCSADCVPAEGFGADVAGDGQAAAASSRLDPPLGLLGVLVLVEVDDRDVGTFPGKRDGGGPADPAVAAGDDGDLVLELIGAAARAPLRIRPRGSSPTRTRAGAPDAAVVAGWRPSFWVQFNEVGFPARHFRWNATGQHSRAVGPGGGPLSDRDRAREDMQTWCPRVAIRSRGILDLVGRRARGLQTFSSKTGVPAPRPPRWVPRPRSQEEHLQSIDGSSHLAASAASFGASSGTASETSPPGPSREGFYLWACSSA